uniref:Putative GDP-mannose 4,6-dehydratase n=1 Tax=viral metagenome TaxID=1070528 RepID=A0A6M3XPF9_9ZZZZ
MKVLVTGNNGFIGRNLTKKLVDLNYEVYGMERYTPTYGLPREVKTFYGELTNYYSIERIIKNLRPEIIIHLAAWSTNDLLAYQLPELITLTNYIGTINLAESSREILKEDLRKFIYASSSEAYGNQSKFPLTEDMVLNPNSPYSISKASSELYLKYLFESYNFPFTILRPFNTYGSMMRRTVIETILTQILHKKKIIELGDPNPLRDFLFITDHVSGYIKCLEEEEKSIGEIFNLATNDPIQIKDLAYLIKDLTNYTGDFKWNIYPSRPNDIKILWGSYEKAKNILNWKPQIKLKDGIQTVYRKWKKELRK